MFFTKYTQFKRHTISHTKEKPYQYEYCQCFSRFHHLKNTHQNSHKIETSSVCILSHVVMLTNGFMFETHLMVLDEHFSEEKGFILHDIENKNSFCWDSIHRLWHKITSTDLFDLLMTGCKISVSSTNSFVYISVVCPHMSQNDYDPSH